MARTKASVGAKVSSGKSSKARCSAAPAAATAGGSGGEKSSRGHSGGNSVCPRETPRWQKPITTFFPANQNPISNADGDDAAAGSSKTKPKKRNVIESDDETEETNDENEKKPNGNKSTNNSESDMNKSESDVNKSESDTIKSDSPPKNRELDESIVLEPLTGENSHRIEEYYTPKTSKGKGVGKRSNKENINRRGSKRELEINLDESPHSNKKVKVN